MKCKIIIFHKNYIKYLTINFDDFDYYCQKYNDCIISIKKIFDQFFYITNFFYLWRGGSGMAPVAGAALFRSVSVCYIESLGQSIVSTNILIDYVLGGRVLKSFVLCGYY